MRTEPTCMPDRMLAIGEVPTPSPDRVLHRYDFDTCHPVSKQTHMNTNFFAFGVEPLVMLLRWGDLLTVRAGIAKVLESHRKMLNQLQQGEATADGCACALPTHVSWGGSGVGEYVRRRATELCASVLSGCATKSSTRVSCLELHCSQRVIERGCVSS